MFQCCRRRSLSDPSRKVWFSKTRLEGKINWKKPEKKYIQEYSTCRERDSNPAYILRKSNVILRLYFGKLRKLPSANDDVT